MFTDPRSLQETLQGSADVFQGSDARILSAKCSAKPWNQPCRYPNIHGPERLVHSAIEISPRHSHAIYMRLRRCEARGLWCLGSSLQSGLLPKRVLFIKFDHDSGPFTRSRRARRNGAEQGWSTKIHEPTIKANSQNLILRT